VVRAVALVGACALFGCSFRVNGVGPGGVDASMPTSSDGDLAGMSAGDDLAGGADLLTGGKLIVSSDVPAAAVDLTQTGSVDWAHWGFGSVSDFDHKASGNGAISTFSLLMGSNRPNQYKSNPTSFSWSDGLDGMGRHPSTNGNTGGVYAFGGGFRITAPADTTPRRLIVHVAVLNAQAVMRIALSDGSAPAWIDTKWKSNNTTTQDAAYTIDYAAASPGQTLVVTWSQSTALGIFASIGLVAAALQEP
jgi:hypothetical protein